MDCIISKVLWLYVVTKALSHINQEWMTDDPPAFLVVELVGGLRTTYVMTSFEEAGRPAPGNGSCWGSSGFI